MERAVQAAHEMLGDEETLFIVTADHGHTMSIGGKYKLITKLYIIFKIIEIKNENIIIFDSMMLIFRLHWKIF